MTETPYIDSSLPKARPKIPKNIHVVAPSLPRFKLVVSRKAIWWLTVAVIVADLLFLNWRTLSQKPQITTNNISSGLSRFNTSDSNECPAACLVAINQAKPVAPDLPQPTPIITASPVPTAFFAPASTGQSVQTTTVKEFFVPLGGGTTTSSNWVTLSGLETQVDSNNYNNIKSVFFEASLRLPTGNGRFYARLINISDNTPLEETVVYIEGSQGQRREIQFSLRSGNKTYGVQIRSTLGFEGILDMARIKIIVN